MSGDIKMGTRTQDSPFRETAWDHRLDKMLDDLKTTVNPDDMRSSSRKDNVMSSYRNTSRNDSRSSNRVEDGGLMKHHHKEYTSPDKGTKIVTDQYEYDSGDPNKFQKKVMKSTYSSYNVKGDISSDLDALRHGPSQAVMDAARATADTQGYEYEDQPQLSIAMEPVSTSSTIESHNKTDSSTLKKLNKNIKELDSMLIDMDREERRKTQQKVTTMVTTQNRTVKHVQPVEANVQFTETSEGIAGCSHIHPSTEGDVTPPFPVEDIELHNTQASSSTTKTEAVESNTQDGYTTRHLPNGRPITDDNEVEYINGGTGGEVRNIVWRNRFEKTYETQDSTAPSMTIEADARRLKHKEYMAKATDISRINPPIPPISPGGQSWADPIPLPTPPQVSPRGEPGVAYVYNYGQSGGTPVQHLPPLNYVQVHGGDGAATPNTGGNQPVIYHYSYHYTMQPGDKLPEGAPSYATATPHLQPALQVAPPIRSMKPGDTVVNRRDPIHTDYAYRSEQSKSTRVVTNENDRTLSDYLLHNHHHYPSNEPKPERPRSGSLPRTGSLTRSGSIPRSGSVPRSPEVTRRNVNISINKSTTNTTHSSDHHHQNTTTTRDIHNGPSYTSTPFPNRERSHSPERYREPLHPKDPHRDPHLYYCKTAADSLDRLRKPYSEPLPFPDTSPITSKSENRIPKRIDDLMTSFSDSEEGLDKGPRGPHVHRTHYKPAANEPEIEPLVSNRNRVEIEERERENSVEIMKKDDTKNVAGPPVYYPPGHHQLFDESMHTMTLKENKRRGMAKWRNEKASGYKESSSSSESKGGMAMVPVCLPLCCGAACTIM